jgi:hypothetical protein
MISHRAEIKTIKFNRLSMLTHTPHEAKIRRRGRLNPRVGVTVSQDEMG